MEPQIFESMQRDEQNHWWFRARRRIAASVLDALALPKHAEILEAGCGSGGNLGMLSAYGTVLAFELYDMARAAAAARGIGSVENGHLPDAIPFKGKAFDLIALFDVLEHVKDDGASLKALVQRLKPQGLLLLTVPAMPLLWSRHDELHHHFRRYRKRELAARLREAGLEIVTLNYLNVLLFIPIMAIRMVERVLPQRVDTVGSKQPGGWLNGLLYQAFACERFLVRRCPFPFGVSLIAVARKRNG